MMVFFLFFCFSPFGVVAATIFFSIIPMAKLELWCGL